MRNIKLKYSEKSTKDLKGHCCMPIGRLSGRCSKLKKKLSQRYSTAVGGRLVVPPGRVLVQEGRLPIPPSNKKRGAVKGAVKTVSKI